MIAGFLLGLLVGVLAGAGSVVVLHDERRRRAEAGRLVPLDPRTKP